MKPTIYIDILFLTNFIIDFFLLYMVKTICKNISPMWRLTCGACIGSLYAVFMFYPNLSLIYSGVFKLIISAVIVLVAFSVKSKREFLSLFMLFYLTGFALAGVTFALFFCTDFGSHVGAAMSNGIFYMNINPIYLISGAFVCYGVMFVCERIYMRRLSTQTNMHTLTVMYGKRSIQVKALLDTANAVSDPITNTPVIVCTTDSLKPLFKDENFYGKLCEAAKTDSDKLKVELVCDTPFRLVPYRALGASSDVMLAFSPTALEVDTKEYGKGALIGLCSGTLSQSQHYDALLHPRIMVGL